MLILVQDHPDPDAIASAVALREVAHLQPDLNCSIATGGGVGRAENRALVAYLGLNLRPFGQLNLGAFDTIALVDTQPGTGNNALPRDVRPDIVIDHHPVRRSSRGLPFTDVRQNYGAGSSILTEYLIAGNIEPEPALATALLYGISSDTQDLGRDASRADIDAHLFLYPRANLRMLAQIRHGPLPPAYFDLLSRALHVARIYGDGIIADLGCLDNPDMMGEVADLLLRRQAMGWCLCFGALPDQVLLSLRTQGPDREAGRLMRRIVGRRGTGGGHNLYAGGQIPRRTGTRAELADIARGIRTRCLRAFDQAGARGEPLLRNEPPSP